MGLKLFRGSEDFLTNTVAEPNIGEYTILFFMTSPNKKYSVVRVKYHNATNYEGIKILVYKGKIPEKLDPHFSDKHKSPIARFEPTGKGLELAIFFIRSLEKLDNLMTKTND